VAIRRQSYEFASQLRDMEKELINKFEIDYSSLYNIEDLNHNQCEYIISNFGGKFNVEERTRMLTIIRDGKINDILK
jgi:hypothetical protein